MIRKRLTPDISIYRRRKTWWWIDICRNGRRLRRSLLTKNLEEAFEMAREVVLAFWGEAKKQVVRRIIEEAREM